MAALNDTHPSSSFTGMTTARQASQLRTKQRVLHVIDHTDDGGAQAVVHNLVQALGDDFSFGVAVLGVSDRYSQAYRRLGIPVFELGSGRGRWSPLPLLGLVTTIRRGGYDLIHTHLFKSSILGAISAKWTRCKMILHDHSGIYPRSLKHRAYLSNVLLRYSYLLAYRCALGYTDHVVVLTPQMRQLYARHYALDSCKVTALPNAVDLDYFNRVEELGLGKSLRTELGLPAEARLVTMVSRLEPEKDCWTFLKVAQQIQGVLGYPCTFLLVGSGSEEGRLRRHVAAQGLESVFLLGHRDDVPTILHQSDVFLLTSRSEAFGIALLEAMAAGCPVVSTRSGGPESILTDGVDGLLAEAGHVQDLTNQVMQILHDRAFAQRLAVSARQKVLDNYTQDAVSGDMASIYTAVLGE